MFSKRFLLIKRITLRKIKFFFCFLSPSAKTTVIVEIYLFYHYLDIHYIIMYTVVIYLSAYYSISLLFLLLYDEYQINNKWVRLTHLLLIWYSSHSRRNSVLPLFDIVISTFKQIFVTLSLFTDNFNSSHQLFLLPFYFTTTKIFMYAGCIINVMLLS